jgi:hypothetical protein
MGEVEMREGALAGCMSLARVMNLETYTSIGR